jgi:hypothetical protein
MMDRHQGMERPPPPLVHTWQSALAVGRRTVTVTMYFLAFFRSAFCRWPPTRKVSS